MKASNQFKLKTIGKQKVEEYRVAKFKYEPKSKPIMRHGSPGNRSALNNTGYGFMDEMKKLGIQI